MLGDIVDNLRVERAEFARDVEYLKEFTSEDMIDACIESAESLYFKETADELKEAAEWADRIKVETADDKIEDEEEVQRILEATEDITFDEMINLDGIKII